VGAVRGHGGGDRRAERAGLGDAGRRRDVLLDTADGCFMNFAYDWAFAKPVRKICYNLTITGLSVFVAFFIGTIELLGLLGQELNLTGGFWSFVAGLSGSRRSRSGTGAWLN
jgi:high-affinity nickel permease